MLSWIVFIIVFIALELALYYFRKRKNKPKSDEISVKDAISAAKSFKGWQAPREGGYIPQGKEINNHQPPPGGGGVVIRRNNDTINTK